ncbi:hypothetical protein [Sporolactobacillus terrae]|uniref:hypothetical protein n=1 Tax=Sporolactobacillus terrae TaxID=269673 RepID=UPI00048EACFB|nr:hypothetical protein [Sporolactobacillus terrae]
MKKVIRVCVAAVLALSLTACGGADSEPNSPHSESEPIKKAAPEQPKNQPSDADSSSSAQTPEKDTKQTPYSGYWISTKNARYSITVRANRILYNDGIGSYGQIKRNDKWTVKANQISLNNAALIANDGQVTGYVTQTLTLSHDKKTLRISKNSARGNKNADAAQFDKAFNTHYSGTFKKVEPTNTKGKTPIHTPSADASSTSTPQTSRYTGVWSNTTQNFTAYYKDQFTDHGPTEPIQKVTIDMPSYNLIKISIEHILGNRQMPGTMKHIVPIDLDGKGSFTFTDSFHNKGGVAKIQLKDNKVYYDLHYTVKPKEAALQEGSHSLHMKKVE